MREAIALYTILWPILRRAMVHPLRTAVIDDLRTWRYIDLVGGAMHLAEKIETRSGATRIGVMLPTSGAFAMATLAAWILGRVVVPINYLLGDEERQYIIDNAELDLVITAGPMLEFLGKRPENVTLLQLDKLRFEGVPPLRLPAIAGADDVAVILYTSGTSGKPKGVMLTHRNFRSNIEDCAKRIELTSADCFLGVLPQFHSFGLTGLTLLPLAVGSRVVYTARFVPKKMIELIRKHKPDIFMAIPSMYGALMSVKDAGPDDMRSIKLAVSGGEPLPRDIADRFRERFDLPIREGYGLTETSPVVSLNTLTHHRDGSVGKLLARNSVKILDERGRDLPVNAEGEVAIAGPNIMAGYFKLPNLTAQVIRDDGYFLTGDWGKMDDEGFLYITGRKKEMLIIAGENVFPREIEEVLNRHPSVRESAVVGRMDPMRGEVPVAFVELEEDAGFDEPALRQFCREHLAGFKVPREIRHIDKLPRNAMGKVLRRALREHL
ncbi:MAG: AMP-binding protein [Planctomycetes bacterium]|nr:AMP-binding protein [Planctomycetota bacterium]